MSASGPYILNLFHTNKYVIENGVVNTFENQLDDTPVIDSRLSYDELLGLSCVTFGWSLEIARKLHILLLFVTHGRRRISLTKKNGNNHYGRSFFAQDDHIDECEQNGPRQEQASNSRVHEEDGGSLFAQDNYMDDDDSDYVAPSESSEARDPSSSSDDEELVNEERELNPFSRRHVYKEIGEWNVSRVYKDDNDIKMWDETSKGMGIKVCFKSQGEAKHALKLWNIHNKRELKSLMEDSPSPPPSSQYNEWFLQPSPIRGELLYLQKQHRSLAVYHDSDSTIKTEPLENRRFDQKFWECYYSDFIPPQGEVLNNVCMRAISFREECRRAYDLDEELENVLDYFADVTHTALTFGKDDEMDIEDSQILVKITRKVRANMSKRTQEESMWEEERNGKRQCEERGRCCFFERITPHEEEVLVTITLGGESQVLKVEPIVTILPETQEQVLHSIESQQQPKGFPKILIRGKDVRRFNPFCDGGEFSASGFLYGKQVPVNTFHGFLSSISGASMNQITCVVGLKHSTPTIACALTTLIPPLIFILAIPVSVPSRVDLLTATIWGTIICVGGAFVLSLYHEQVIKIGQSSIHRKLTVVATMGISSQISSASLAVWITIQVSQHY
ncbi:OLC1v1015758C1 [Oldenlandia corymbosa var. corymbosa]|uniref:OLC1v1015758C1 n=1 Tax=Oldenlandia corymbosa var. corymbosa TaxID=529605 RepID=A0AAV1E6Y1_OLDCO|nr:OLC1v1015758C1 [Oldenlandia corymbosa var. corymbosa]